jgi:hypothetical protein
MRCFIHIVTDRERIVDPEGAEFSDLAMARTEACQSARDLMAEELRCGRPVPLAWRAQVADEAGIILATLPFAELVFGEGVSTQMLRTSGTTSPEMHLALIERAKVTFARARRSHSEIRTGLDELRAQLRRLAQYTGALGHR